jgi:hypothetical membrane protein
MDRMRASTGPLLAAGVIGPVLFVVAFLIEGATRAGYDASRMFVSQLSLGDGGWTQIANFIVTGLLFVAFAFELGRTLAQGRGTTWGPRLIGAAGIGLVLAGVFVADPALGYPPGTPPGIGESTSDHGAIHELAAVLVFGAIPAAAIVLSRRFATQPGSSGMRRYSLATAVIMLAFVIAANAAAFDGGLRLVAGLLQRVSIITGLAWVAVLAVRTMRQEPPS